ncbi:MAG: YihY/virulence factor BrkB family protein [Cyclobacteriaceae bacterium]
MIKKLYKNFLLAKQFIEVDIWRIRLKKYDKSTYLLYKNFKILLIATKSFIADKCAIKSSALTYFSLLSIVPVLAIAFAIAKAFNLDKFLKDQINLLFANQQSILEQSWTYADNMLKQTSGGLLAGISLVILLYTVINLLTNIESIFNDIWEIKKGRKLNRKLTDYLSIMLAGPVLIILSSGLNGFITTQLEYYSDTVQVVDIKPVVRMFIRLIPFTLFCMLFTLMYVIMPNTRVRIKPAFIAGAISAMLYTIAQWGYFEFQVGVSRFNAIYAGFAALPLFLIWLQISWMIILFGAELTFAIQNVNTWEYNPEKLKMSQYFKKKMALIIVSLAAKQFESAKEPFTAYELSEKIEAPLRYVKEVLRELVETDVLSEVINKNSEDVCYQPGIDINKLTIQYVIDRISNYGLDNVHLSYSDVRTHLEESLQIISDDKLNSRGNILVKDL